MSQTSGNSKTTSVHEALATLFPEGTEPQFSKSCDRCPALPTTVFGAAGYLIERGGVYHRLVLTGPSGELPAGWDKSNLALPESRINEWQAIGQSWFDATRKVKSAPEAERAAAQEELKAAFGRVQRVWDKLIQHANEPVVKRPLPTEPLDWWIHALALLIIADEAAEGSGFTTDQLGESLILNEFDAPDYVQLKNNPTHLINITPQFTHALWLNTYMARVIPKARTPSVGCTMRALSHNLALAPPEGVVDVCWYRQLRPSPDDRDPLNLLLIPLPYRIPAFAFRECERYVPSRSSPTGYEGGAPAAFGGDGMPRTGNKPWGTFTIDQTWLKNDKGESQHETCAEFICDLIRQAQADVGRVHGVVLPELALDWTCHAELVKKVQSQACAESGKGRRPFIDFLVCGLSSREDGAEVEVFSEAEPTASAGSWPERNGKAGNYVATTTFSLDDRGVCYALTSRRSKHHRWQMTSSQIGAYALASALDPNFVWWESMELPKRELGLTVFRKNAVFSAMICEDLARSEPCHEPLRATGPNVVFVLLMDGPQLPNRWSARYATTLADDPGSSVLTLTSLALMERANDVCPERASRNIALWKDDTGETVELSCPHDAQGVLVTLSGTSAEEMTLDGRANRDTQAWRYRGHRPVRLPAAKLEMLKDTNIF